LTNSRNDGVVTVLRNLGHGFALASAAVLATGCHRAPAPTIAPSGPDAAARHLEQRVNALLAAPGLESSTWGVLVRSLERGDTIYAEGAGRLLVPASSLKVVTLAAAADRLGWDYSYETRLVGSGPIASGVLAGDLTVSGSGDPSIDDWDGLATLLFRSWSDRLQELAIREVAGRLVCDDNEFDDEPLGTGWAWDDLSASYAAGVGALQFNQNTVRLAVTPGAAPGEPGHVSSIPPIHDLTLDNQVITGLAGTPVALSIRRLPGDSMLTIGGSLPVGSPAVFRNVSVDNPSIYFGQVLQRALAADGIDIRGAVVDIDAIGDAPSRADAADLIIHRSNPLSILAATMMKNSQNLYAETLLKTLGRHAGPGTFDAGLNAVQSTLESWGIDTGRLRLADGSGLSRYNLVTADLLVEVLTRVYEDDRLREPFQAALPLAGREGTLEGRLNGTAAEGNARAKTGSLSNIRTLTGYVQTADGEPLAFSILANNVVSSTQADETIDAIVVALAEFSRR
jgi:D-alanyl-D-alanine carboxypeptidase/D-alanyl-D-alanine-endopeptidase (penicillin-binding protein 4)